MEVTNNSTIESVIDFANVKFGMEVTRDQISEQLKNLSFSETLKLINSIKADDNDAFSEIIDLSSFSEAVGHYQKLMLTYGEPGGDAKVYYTDYMQDLQNRAQEFRKKGFIIGKMGRSVPLNQLPKKMPMKGVEIKEIIDIAKDKTKKHTLPRIDTEKYQERDGLEGPIATRSGKTVYYDPKEGKYYDPDTDMYIADEDMIALTRGPSFEGKDDVDPFSKEGWAKNKKYKTGSKTGDWMGKEEKKRGNKRYGKYEDGVWHSHSTSDPKKWQELIAKGYTLVEDDPTMTPATLRIRKLAGLKENPGAVYTTDAGPNGEMSSPTMHGLLDQIEDYYHYMTGDENLDVQISDDHVYIGNEKFDIYKDGENLGSDLYNELEREDISKGKGPYQHKLSGDDLERSKTMTPDQIKVLARLEGDTGSFSEGNVTENDGRGKYAHPKTQETLEAIRELYELSKETYQQKEWLKKLESVYDGVISNWYYPSERHGIPDIRGDKVRRDTAHDPNPDAPQPPYGESVKEDDDTKFPNRPIDAFGPEEDNYEQPKQDAWGPRGRELQELVDTYWDSLPDNMKDDLKGFYDGPQESINEQPKQDARADAARGMWASSKEIQKRFKTWQDFMNSEDFDEWLDDKFRDEINELGYGSSSTAQPSRATINKQNSNVANRRYNITVQDQNRDAKVVNKTVAGSNIQATGQGAVRAGSEDPDDIERAENSYQANANAEQASINAQEIERLKQLAMGS